MKHLITLLVASLVSLQLHAQWNGTGTTGTITRTGNVGIGPETSIPGYVSLYLSNGGGLYPHLIFKNSDASVDNRLWSVMAQGGSFRILTQLDNGQAIQDALRISRSGVNVNTISFPNGNVAIGTPLTTNPNGYKLAVNGKIGAKEVQVENTSSTWADYVFEPTYKLMSLQEVESFIKAHKHLPEIPSAEEVKENGHKLGEMDVLLLKKIEELTLYVIELKKENEEQSKHIQKLQEKK